jgi:hypothetical protein
MISAALTLNPNRRPTAQQLLQFNYIKGFLKTYDCRQEACPIDPPLAKAKLSDLLTLVEAVAERDAVKRQVPLSNHLR